MDKQDQYFQGTVSNGIKNSHCTKVLASSKTELHQFIILTPDVRVDMFMWLSLLETWNGVSVFGDKEFTLASTLRLFTDSSSTIGFGAYLQSSEQFLVDSWRNHPLPVTDRSMSYLELYPIVISAIVWGESWKGRKILLFSDNQGTVSILNKGRSQCPEINKLMRRLVIICTRFNFTLSAKWISTKTIFTQICYQGGVLLSFRNCAQMPPKSRAHNNRRFSSLLAPVLQIHGRKRVNSKCVCLRGETIQDILCTLKSSV